MTHRAGDAKSSPRPGLLVLAVVASALVVGVAGYWATQTLRRDDCTAVTNTMPDGSQITIKTCS